MSENKNKEEQLKALEDIISRELEEGTYLEKLIEANKGSNIALSSKAGVSKKLAEKMGYEYIDVSSDAGLKQYQEMMQNNPDAKAMLNFPTSKPKYRAKKKVHVKKKENNIQFILGQVKDILDDMHFDDLPFDSDIDLGVKLKMFNHMPQTLQGECVMWGSNDTEVRSNIAEWMCKTHLGISLSEWYDSENAKVFFANNHEPNIEIDFTKFYV